MEQDGPADRPATTPAPDLLGRARLDELLQELLARVGDALDTQDRLRGLLDAVVGINSDLSLERAVQRIVTAACELVGARYGALGILGPGPGRRLRAFVTHGLTDEERAAIGDLPRGHGILGVIIDDPQPLRLTSLTEHAASYGFPAHHPPMHTFLGVPVRTRTTVFGNLYLTEKRGGGSFTAEDEEVVVALAAAAGVVVENARLYAESQRRQRWLAASAEVSAALLSGPESEGLVRVVAAAREVAGAAGAVLLVRADGVLVTAAADGTVVPALADRAADVAAGAPSVVDAEAPGLLVPVRSETGVDGVLVLGWAGDGEPDFRDTDVRLVSAYADQVALALQVARSREDRSRLAVFEDRDRIGRDLHDLVIQRLFAIGLTLDNAGRLTDRPEVAQRLSTAVDDIDETIKDIRRTIFELSPPATAPDLRAEIGATVGVIAPALGFAPRVVTEGPVDTVVGDDVRPHLLAVLREALSNVARHARASSVEVRLSAGDDVVLTVTDDGVGYQSGGRRSGLAHLEARAAALGGSCTVRGVPGTGTEVRWQVPARR